MKKIIALLLALSFVFVAVACTQSEEPAPSPTPESVEPTPETPEETPEAPVAGTYEIALVTDVGNIDDKSFNQGSWEGVVAFAEQNNITYSYYRPSEDSTVSRVETIKSAIDKGAKVVVCPGYLFEEAIYEVQESYPNVMFLLVDGQPQAGDYVTYYTADNTHCILYKEEQAGYFAGYAAVKDGYTKLGFLGGVAVPAVVRYGYGFVLGANAAAEEMGITDQIDIKYWYSDSFLANDDIKTKMSGWFTEGTEVVFACGGSIYLSCVAAAEEAGAKVIGVDVDQAAESELIITSAMKGLTNSIIIALNALYGNDGVWPEGYAGVTANLGVENDCVGLPTAAESWRLNTFTVAEYEVLYEKVKSGEIVVSNATDVEPEVAITVDYQG